MPSRPRTTFVVLLSEVLEVRGKALDENQIWSLIYQSAETLHDAVLAEETHDGQQPVLFIMPEILSLSSDGSIRFERCARQSFERSKYCSFEWQAGLVDATDATAIEKMWIYALGMTAYTCADYSRKSDEALHVTESLTACLACMVEREVDRRYMLIDVIEACIKYSNRRMSQPFCYYIQAMYKTVLGTPPNEAEIVSLMDCSSLTQSPMRTLVEKSESRARKREAPEDAAYKLNYFDSVPDWPRLLCARCLTSPEIDASGLRSADLIGTSGPVSPVGATRQATRNVSPLWEIIGSLGSPKKPLLEDMQNEDVLRAAYSRIIDRRQKLLLLSDGINRVPSNGPASGRRDSFAGAPITQLPLSPIGINQPIAEENTSVTSALASLYSSTVSLTNGSFYPGSGHVTSGSLEEPDDVVRDAESSTSGRTDAVHTVNLHGVVVPSEESSICVRKPSETCANTEMPDELMHSEQAHATESQVHGDGSSPKMSAACGLPLPATAAAAAPGVSVLPPTSQRTANAAITPGRSISTTAASDAKPRSATSRSSTTARKKPQMANLGPEPVRNSGQAVREIPFYLPGKQKGKVASIVSSPTLHKSVLITHLTGERIRMHCTASTTGGQIFKAFTDETDLKEQYYFGLTYVKDGEHFFIDEETKMQKIAPDYWKKENSSLSESLGLYVRIKYYAESINALRQPSSRHGLYLQLRTDVLEELLVATATDEALAALGGLALQAEYGDCSEVFGDPAYFLPQHYLPAGALKRQPESHWKVTLSASHARHSGLSQVEAETKFIEACQRLQEYGIHFYRVFTTEAQATSFSSAFPSGGGLSTGLVWLGLSTSGIYVREALDLDRTPPVILPWNTLQKLSFNRRKVTLVTQVTLEQPKAHRKSYFTDSHKKSKYLVLLAATLQRYRRPAVTVSHGNLISVTALGDAPSATSDRLWNSTSENLRKRKAPTSIALTSTLPGGGASGPARTSSPEGLVQEGRQIVTTVVQKNAEGIGISLVGIHDTLRFGVFVAEVAPDGPSSRNGNVHVGDRIMAINGQTIEGTSHQHVYDKIRRAPSQIQLVLSRTAKPNRDHDVPSGASNRSPPDVTSESRSNRVGTESSMRRRSPGDIVAGSSCDNRKRSPAVAEEMGVDSASCQLSAETDSDEHDGAISSDEDVVLSRSERAMSAVQQHLPIEDGFSVGSVSAFQKPAQRMHSGQSASQNVTSPSSDSSAFSGPFHDTDQEPGETVQLAAAADSRVEQPAAARQHAQDPVTGSRQLSAKRSSPGDGASSDEEVSVVMTGPFTKAATKVKLEPSLTAMPKKPSDFGTVVSVNSSTLSAVLQTPINDNLNVGDRYEALLGKINGSLGLNVTGGTNTSVRHGGIYVKSLTPGGPAERCANIHLGDRVLAVNGVDLTAVTHRLAVETLRNAQTPVRILLERGEPPTSVHRPTDDRQATGAQTQGTPSLPGTRPSSEVASLTQAVSPISISGSFGEASNGSAVTPVASSTPTLSTPCLFESGLHFDVVLKKETNGFGFSILGGRTLGITDVKKSLLRVKKIFPLGAASREGSIQVGDVIMGVNGQPLEGFTHAEAVQLLRACPSEVKLSVYRADVRVLSPLVESDVPSRQSSAVSPTLQTESDKPDANEKIQVADDNVSLATVDLSSSIESEITVVTAGASKREHDNVATSQPTPIRELDDVLQANTTLSSLHVSGSHTPSVATPELKDRKVFLPRRSSTSGLHPSSLAERLRMAMGNSASSSRRSSFSVPDGQGTERGAAASVTESQVSSEADDAKQPVVVIDVTLQKNENGSLGFSVMGGTEGGCFIKAILQDPASADGRLHAGDRLLMANGKDMMNMTAATAVQYLRQAPAIVNISVQRSLVSRGETETLEDTLHAEHSSIMGASSLVPTDPNTSIAFPTCANRTSSVEDRMVAGSGISDKFGDDSSNSSSGDEELEPEKLESISLSSSDSRHILGDAEMDGADAAAVVSDLLPLDVARHLPGTAASRQASLSQVLGGNSSEPGLVNKTADTDSTVEKAAFSLEVVIPAGSNEFGDGTSSITHAVTAIDTANYSVSLQQDSIAEVHVLKNTVDVRETTQPSQEPVQKTINKASSSNAALNKELHGSPTKSMLSEADSETASAVIRRESIRLLPTEDIIRVSLTKPPGGGLGFSINCEEQDGHLYVFVKAVTPGGVAETDGRLRAGDRLLKVNEVNIAGYTQPKAVALIRQLHGVVHLLLARQQSRPVSPSTELSPQHSDRSSSGEDVSVVLASSLKSTTEGDSTDNAKELRDSRHILMDTFSSETDGKGKEVSPFEDSDEDPSPPSDIDFDLPDDSNASTGRASANLAEAISRHWTPQTKLDLSLLNSTTKSDKSLGQESERPIRGGLNSGRSPLTLLPSATLSNSDDVEGELSDAADEQRPAKSANIPQLRRNAPSSPWYGGESAGIPLFGHFVTDDWVNSLPAVKVGAKGMYAGSALDRTVAQLRMKMANDDPSEEFKAMRNIKPTDDCNEGKALPNKSLNRFRNVLPYDFNRVILSGDSDYINASHVRIPLGEDMLHYIACQGPLPQTTPHFWQMVVEQKVQVIAMLTLDVENGKVKCHRYWPDSPNTPLLVSERYKVTLSKAYETEHFDVRYVTVRDELSSSLQHQAIHLIYKTWPDRGVPSSAQPLLQFLRVIHEFHVTGPIALHCSAGIGRTGVLIALDVILSCIAKDLKFDINQIITDLRKQRQGMIQTKDQYLFCYDACIQALECIE